MKTKSGSLLLLSLLISRSDAAAQTPYFQGKTIRFIVGYPAASTHDIVNQMKKLMGE